MCNPKLVPPVIAPKKETENTGGENPYIYVALHLGIASQMEEQIKIYASSSRTEADYQALIDWEVENFSQAYKKQYGHLPVEGDIESLFPPSTPTPSARMILNELNLRGIKAGVVSSGFKYLVDPAVAELGIPSECSFANRFTYNKINGFMDGVEVNVSGNKVGALKKATAFFETQGIKSNEIAYVGDNNWDLDAILYILNKGGYIFYLQPLGNEESKLYPLSDVSLFDHNRFHIIYSLTDILENREIGISIKAIIYDADGTLINTN